MFSEIDQNEKISGKDSGPARYPYEKENKTEGPY